MAKHTFNKEFDKRNIPEGTLGGIVNNATFDRHKVVSIAGDLEELDEREKRMFRR